MPSPVDTAAAPLLFAIPGRYELIERSRELAGSDALAHLERERATARAISDAYLETVVEGLVLVFLEQGAAMGHGTASLLRNLAGVITSVARSILHGGLARAGTEELLALRAFLRERVRATPEGPWPGLLVFPLDAATSARVSRVVQAVHADRVRDEREALSAAMLAVVDGAIHHHFERPVALLRPGFVLRQALGVSVAAIRSGSHAVLRRAIMHEGDRQLLTLARFLESSTSRAAA